jgi:hypothetical protein
MCDQGVKVGELVDCRPTGSLFQVLTLRGHTIVRDRAPSQQLSPMQLKSQS